jgi:hypothetical protein
VSDVGIVAARTTRRSRSLDRRRQDARELEPRLRFLDGERITRLAKAPAAAYECNRGRLAKRVLGRNPPGRQ